MARARRLGWLALAMGAMAAMAFFHGCGGSSDDGTGGTSHKDGGKDGTAGDGNVNPNCSAAGKSCATSSDCCSAFCDPSLNVCANATNCKAPGDACTAATECCTMVCSGGKCGSGACTSDLKPCTTDGQCCGGKCAVDPDAGASVCIPLNPSCRSSGNQCSANADCCSSYCQNGLCSGSPSYCRQTGDSCASKAECCTGVCTIASGATLGVCAQPTAPGTTGCLVAGEVCSGGATGSADAGVPACGGECCSRACAPYGPTGVLVCQPPSGCHPTGEICAKDADCCGSAGLPGGNGSVKCSMGAGESVGRCDNGNACRPAGAVCKLATSSCNAENNCCAGNVNQDPTVCQQDLLGIPRCTGVGSCADAGSKAGAECATSADCCGLPCVPNPSGTPPYICGSACVPAGGQCTTNADCCAGLPCVTPPGSTQGICGYTPPPDAGTDAAIPDSGVGCALYGQTCTTAADCCGGVPCTGGRCVYIVQ